METASGGFVSDTLQRKLKDLEEENLSLRSEASHLKSETETYEEKEQQLVNDCVNELSTSPFVPFSSLQCFYFCRHV